MKMKNKVMCVAQLGFASCLFNDSSSYRIIQNLLLFLLSEA